ncbi:glycosyltransferase family 2 protein [Neptunicella marina]|uniref:Glycosyltransferase family 2 protein n=1 Tax=Neptunicella marina TaxID=2125989 RepID=A0A8J6M0L4_9ALTE|nr:glycosyltransferase family 2 protein [Neptunicella marina]
MGAVIVLFNPFLAEAQALVNKVSGQVDALCVIDNSPRPSELNLDRANLSYHHFSSNIGIAAAQNVGLSDLCLAKCDRALLLDQDSLVDEYFVKSLSDQLSSAQTDNKRVIAIGPRIVCSFSEKLVKPRVQKELFVHEDFVCVTQIISSGMLIDLHQLELTGFKDERLFIDGVDHEWCWRARRKNFDVAIANNLYMVHRLGDARSKFAGITYKVGSPIRLYYQFRNILILTRRDYVPLYWKIRNILVMPIRFFANTFLQNNKKERLIFMVRGIWDGLRMRDGSYNDNW